jgi:hypothetical protein
VIVVGKYTCPAGGYIRTITQVGDFGALTAFSQCLGTLDTEFLSQAELTTPADITASAAGVACAVFR